MTGLFTRRLVAALALAAAAFCVPAAAQQAPTASHLAVAREVVVNSGMSTSFDTIPLTVALSFKNATTPTRPDTAKDFDTVFGEMTPYFASLRVEMITIATKIVADKFTEPELKELNAFLITPVGKKYVALQPTLLDDMVNAMVEWGQKMETTIIDKIREEMKKKGHDL